MSDAPHTDQAYGDILRLEPLLASAHVHEGSPERMFFLVTHQACELWFALVLGHLDAAARALRDDEADAAAGWLERLPSVVRVLVAQFDALTTLAPADFEGIRTALGSASGIQSAQFREIEYACGLRDTRALSTRGFSEAERDRLRRRLTEQSVADAYERLVKRRGHADAGVIRVRAALLDFDEAFVVWRARHAGLAERFLGGRRGTGGSEGPAYLWRAAGKRLFPDVWGAA
ncbi:tryptophan 2,3-dioxygenase family protein [Saccharothrix xinjiangensis]|uniref:Tryptophan 2,3-dioxygenase family protein n=1 Tax=Saccharothrix xinjiangensis TaxID=204798 RepID=A0ABV9Y1U4_9PSEU